MPLNKENKTLADVKVGDKVTLRYAEADGASTAKAIYMQAAKPAEKKAEKKAAKKAMKKSMKKAEPAPEEDK